MNRKKVADVVVWPAVFVVEFVLDSIFELYELTERIYDNRSKGK